MAGEFHLRTLLLLLATDRQVSFSLSITFFSVFGSWSMTLTPIRANGLFFSFVTSDRSWGQWARHVSQYSCQK